jgi:GT2 family glycosyltransferase
MIKKKFNIIIPSLTLSSELINCLLKFNNQKYKNFFVTIVLDYSNKKKIPKLNYKLNILIVGKRTMSYKRNYAVKKFKSDLIAFIDSDAYPNKDWLLHGKNILSKKNNEIIGGPSLPFPNQSFEEMMCHYAKRSYFVTGYLNFRKYKAKSRYCDWLESCNLMMSRKLFLKFGGMNENIYVGEDKEFIERFKKQNPSIKVFYSPRLFIYHKERNLIKFLIQRMVFGADLYNITNFNYKLNSFQPLLPLITFIFFISIFFLVESYFLKLKLLVFFVITIQILILTNLIKYLNNLRKILTVLLIVNMANIAFIVGNILEFTGIKFLINRKMYLKSRNNK